MNRDYPITSQRRLPLKSTAPNFVLGVLIQMARRYLFIDPKKKAVLFLGFVTLLSVIGSFITFDESIYIIQKHSVLNQYGVKLGWMWTCFIVGPFIWFTSRAHYRDRDKSLIDILRLAVATACWYFSVMQFHRIMQWTSRCDIGFRYSREQCKEKGGVWIPGFDISGHCFILVYSMLVMSEEANAFREWNLVIHRDDDSGLVLREKQERRVKFAQYFIVLMLLLNVVWVVKLGRPKEHGYFCRQLLLCGWTFWINQLAISVLYYHILVDKVAGALIAIFCWYVTYHILYPAGFLQPPIHRVEPLSNLRR